MIQSIQNAEGYSLQLISDIAKSMEDRKKLRRMYGKLLVYGILGEVAEIATLILWIRTGMWIPFVIAVISVMLVGLMLVQYVLGRTAFICPNCHSIFRPGYKEYLFSHHTPKTRKLICPACRHKSYCIETTREPITVHEQVDTEENNSNIIR